MADATRSALSVPLPLTRGRPLLYNLYEMQRSLMTGASAWASIASEMLTNPALPTGYSGMAPIAASALEVFAHAAAPRGKPAFDIETVTSGGTVYPVVESIVLHRAFGNLLRFTRADLPKDAPRLLIVAPMSGHFATLLRGTVARMIERCEVYVTDWADAKIDRKSTRLNSSHPRLSRMPSSA